MTAPYNLIVILGPTASGKTRLAVCLASVLGSEIISADSRQVYIGMDIGTGKDKGEYIIDGKALRHHLIDIVDPMDEFSVFSFRRCFLDVYVDMRSRGNLPILVGGTGLYLDSVLRGYDMPDAPIHDTLRRELAGVDNDDLVRRLKSLRPTLHNTTDLRQRERLIRAIEIEERRAVSQPDGGNQPEIRALILGIHWERDVQRSRITNRLERRLEGGLIAEVEGLHRRGVTWERLEAFGLEYRYVGRYLQNKISREEMVHELNTRIHQFARRQMSWFRRMERLGLTIHWIEGDDDKRALDIVRHALED